MGSKHNWIGNYNRIGDTIEIIIRDQSGARREKWIINCNDKKRIRQVLRTLKDKWNIDFTKAMITKDKDLEWLE